MVDLQSEPQMVDLHMRWIDCGAAEKVTLEQRTSFSPS